jgi:hypothetical protein
MKANRKTGWVALAIALAAVSQVPRLLHADFPGPVVSTTAEPTLADLATSAISADAAISKPAIDKLRAAGPAGLDALMKANESAITAHRIGAGSSRPGAADPKWDHLTAALDAVAAQRDAYASGLYWYTDLAAAESAAKASGKTILSLRLLGNLNNEYSCANSRFFRTVLYANNEVARHLRDHFILHWQSVRPVPIITIDFGDGRIIRRTITGNSIHYVLTADGQVVDGIPGLYGAKAFLRELGEAEAEITGAGASRSSLVQWHSDQAGRISEAFSKDRRAIGLTTLQKVDPASPLAVSPHDVSVTGADSAMPRSPLAMFKAENLEYHMEDFAVMSPDVTPGTGLVFSRTVYEKGQIILDIGTTLNIGARIVVPDIFHKEVTSEDLGLSELPSVTELTDADWSRIAALHADDVVLDNGSRSLMAAKTPDAVTATRLTMSKSVLETPLVRMMRNFQRSIAEDTVRNEYLLHSQIHRWLSDPSQIALTKDVSLLNKRVYAELFLTPDSDPWLGLVPADTYSALDDGGVCH